MKIQIYTKNVYGNELVYPANESAKDFLLLTGAKTFSQNQLSIIRKLGYQIELLMPPASMKAIGFVTEMRAVK